MSDDPTFDRTARIWLEDGPGEAPDDVIQAALLAIETTPMERDLRIPWRFPPMIRSSFAAVAIVAVVAVGGVAIWRNQSSTPTAGGTTPTANPSLSASAAPSPSAEPAQGELVVGTTYATTGFSQPMTFTLPSGWPQGPVPIADPGASGHTWRLWSQGAWAVTFHDDVLLPTDLCAPTSGLAPLPATPDAIMAWLAASSGTTLSAPVTLQVDGRTATAWDVSFGPACQGNRSADVYVSANEQHRFYAIPTGTDTILAITWDTAAAPADKLVESLTFP
jgi:hypothetical protein